MKSTITILLLLLALIGCASTQSAFVPEDAVAVAEGEGIFRFGTVYEGETVQATFLVVNDSDYRLTIDHVESNCGCTTAKLNNKDIPPRSTLSVHVSLNTNRLWGPQSKSVILFTNAPWRPQIKLLLEGIVQQRLSFEPRRISSITTEANYRTRIRLINVSTERQQLTEIKTKPDELLRVQLENRGLPATLEPGESLIFVVEADLNHPGATLTGSVTFHLEGIEEPIRLPVFLERSN